MILKVKWPRAPRESNSETHRGGEGTLLTAVPSRPIFSVRMLAGQWQQLGPRDICQDQTLTFLTSLFLSKYEWVKSTQSLYRLPILALWKSGRSGIAWRVRPKFPGSGWQVWTWLSDLLAELPWKCYITSLNRGFLLCLQLVLLLWNKCFNGRMTKGSGGFGESGSFCLSLQRKVS